LIQLTRDCANEANEEARMAPPSVEKYKLKGLQVDPGAGYWMYCSQLHVLTIEELTQVTENSHSDHFFPPPPPDAAVTAKEFEELLDLAKWRDDPCKLVSPSPCPKIKEDDRRPCHRPKELPQAYDCRRPISKLLNLTPPPLGAVLVNRFPSEQIIRTGRGMARAVEGETPGLYHRHALNYLIGSRSWSPPRQALVWAALDVALASALQAAWYYKWINPRTAFRERPVEYARRTGKVKELHVLFDRPDELNPAYNLCPDGRPDKHGHFPDNDSGTPRHPAYPSGHSTYSGAASEILNFFFGAETTPGSLPAHPALGSLPGTTIGEELDNMADNIGMGRLWAGIHWRSDHEAGLKLGRTVACLILHQLERMVSDLPHGFVLCPQDLGTLANQCDLSEKLKGCDESKKPPTREELEKEAEERKSSCSSPIRPDRPPTTELPKPCDPPPQPIGERLDVNRGVQRGAQ
jgi:hypothetical protein